MKQYSFLQEVFDSQTTKMRAKNVALQPIRSAKSGFKGGAILGGTIGALAGAKKGLGGAVKGAIAGGAIGGAAGGVAGTAWGATGGQIKNITNSRQQLIDRDNAIRQGTLKNPLASRHAKNVARAKIVKNNLISNNLQNYRDAIAQTPDAVDRQMIKQQYKETNKWIGDRHQANMYNT